MKYDVATMLLNLITSSNIAIESSAQLPQLHSLNPYHTLVTIGIKMWIRGPNGLDSRLTAVTSPEFKP